MRFINSKTHSILDYLMGIVLILSPFIFGFWQGNAAGWILIILGGGLIIYSMVTDYEFSATKAISLKTHLTLDVISGVFLALSPWLFGFADQVFWPHLIFGIFEIGAGLMTKTIPDYKTIHAQQSDL